MFPNEVAILIAIRENEGLGLHQLTYVTDIRGSYLRYICNSMCQDGYLERTNSVGYKATWKGKEAIFETLHEN